MARWWRQTARPARGLASCCSLCSPAARQNSPPPAHALGVWCKRDPPQQAVFTAECKRDALGRAQEMVVTRILEGGTAHRTQQLLAGDVIVSIDGLITQGWDLPKVRGPQGVGCADRRDTSVLSPLRWLLTLHQSPRTHAPTRHALARSLPPESLCARLTFALPACTGRELLDRPRVQHCKPPRPFRLRPPRPARGR